MQKIFQWLLNWFFVAKKTALPCSYKFAPLFPNDSMEGPLLRDLYEDKLVEIR